MPPELLNDDYCFVNKLKVVSKTSDGVSYSVTGCQSAKDNTIDGDVSIKTKIQSATLTTKLLTGGTGTAELKLDDLGVKGLSSKLLAGIGKNVAVGTVEYAEGRVGVTSGFNYFSGPSAYGSLAVAVTPAKFAGYAVLGVESALNTETREPTFVNVAASFFDGKESECTVHVLDKGTKGMVSYSHHVRPGFSVGSQMTYDRGTKDTNLIMGSAYRLDGATTVKGKVDSTGLLALTYIQDIRPKTTLILSTKFSVNNFANSNIGCSLTFE